MKNVIDTELGVKLMGKKDNTPQPLTHKELMAKERLEAAVELAKSNTQENEEPVEIFEYNCTAFMPVFNEARGAYDLLYVRIDTDNDTAIIEREQTRYDSVQRAILDVKLRYEKELVDNRRVK